MAVGIAIELFYETSKGRFIKRENREGKNPPVHPFRLDWCTRRQLHSPSKTRCIHRRIAREPVVATQSAAKTRNPTTRNFLFFFPFLSVHSSGRFIDQVAAAACHAGNFPTNGGQIMGTRNGETLFFRSLLLGGLKLPAILQTCCFVSSNRCAHSPNHCETIRWINHHIPWLAFSPPSLSASSHPIQYQAYTGGMTHPLHHLLLQRPRDHRMCAPKREAGQVLLLYYYCLAKRSEKEKKGTASWLVFFQAQWYCCSLQPRVYYPWLTSSFLRSDVLFDIIHKKMIQAPSTSLESFPWQKTHNWASCLPPIFYFFWYFQS